jgi:hypothetical protein
MSSELTNENHNISSQYIELSENSANNENVTEYYNAIMNAFANPNTYNVINFNYIECNTGKIQHECHEMLLLYSYISQYNYALHNFANCTKVSHCTLALSYDKKEIYYVKFDDNKKELCIHSILISNNMSTTYLEPCLKLRRCSDNPNMHSYVKAIFKACENPNTCVTIDFTGEGELDYECMEMLLLHCYFFDNNYKILNFVNQTKVLHSTLALCYNSKNTYYVHFNGNTKEVVVEFVEFEKH